MILADALPWLNFIKICVSRQLNGESGFNPWFARLKKFDPLTKAFFRSHFALTLASVLTIQVFAADKDIRELSQNFIDPGGEIAPWMVVPEDNVKRISTD